jgi:hypothetical protein
MSKAQEIVAAREELSRLNQELGFRQDGPVLLAGSPVSGGLENGSGTSQTAAVPPAQPEPQTDPGPPRFIFVNFDQNVAGLSGGAFIPVTPESSGAIVDILLRELRAHLDRTLSLVAATHTRKPDPAQIEIPFDAPTPD